MRRPVSEIIKEVKICIDEIGINDAEFIGEQDNSEMETIIRQKILEALRFVYSNADWAFIEPDTILTELSGTDMNINNELVGHITLPDNYMRLCYAKFDSWPIYATEIIYWNDTAYSTLHDTYATGTWERPKIALVKTPKNRLELYSAKEPNEKWKIGIITKPEIKIEEDGSENVYISDKLRPSLIYYIAGLTLLTYNEQRADNMFNQAMILMGITPPMAQTENQ